MKILVVGLGISGVAAAKFLKQQGADVRCTDSSTNNELQQIRTELESQAIPVEIGGHTDEFAADAELVITSPGVPLWARPIVFAHEKGVPVIGEIELAWQFCHGPVVAITGSNGKSTTATLLNEVLKTAGIKSRLCGNIGIPLVEEVEKAAENEILVTEVSSFQLETTQDFKPFVSVILNITPNHLDRYRSMEEYTSAKFRIFDKQDDGCFSILNEELKNAVESYLRGKKKPNLIYFGRSRHLDIRIGKESIAANIKGFPPVEILRNDVRHLIGEHNIENIAAVIGAAIVLGAGEDAIRKTVNEFRGLEHRLEFVAENDGVKYINDSKATTVDAVLTALDTVENNVILIAGGRNKGGDFTGLCESVRKKVKVLILIGEAAKLISDAMYPGTRTEFACSMHDAVSLAKALSAPGDTVLLSPACASFDMFRNFEERGEVYKKEVMMIKNNRSMKTKGKE